MTPLLFPSASGETPVAKRARRLLVTTPDEIWHGPTAQSLFQSGSDRWLVHSRCKGAWQRSLKWVSEYDTFAREMCHEVNRKFDWNECLGCVVLCYLFLVRVANEDRGSTRPAAARRALSRQRKQLGLHSLNEDPRISALIRGVRNARPNLRRQMESLDVNDVVAVSEEWGRAAVWWKRMVATMMASGFLTVMRCGEMVRLLRRGVVLVLRSGREVNLRECIVLPKAEECEGMLLLVVWRKSKQAANAWLPVSCQTTIRMMIQHERFLRSVGSTTKYCFPARRKTSKSAFDLPKEVNCMSTASFVRLMKRALMEVCQVDVEEAKLYGGHSLRVGGSNFMRWLGVDEDVHRSLGGWAVLTSAKEYMQLAPTEQFRVTKALALKKRLCGVENKREARALLGAVTPVVLSTG